MRETTGAPMTYESRSGRQFVVVVTGRGAEATLVACALGVQPAPSGLEAGASPGKDRPTGAIGGDSDRSATGILDAHPIGFRTRNV